MNDRDAPAPSPALLAAQKGLLQRRAKLQAERKALGLPKPPSPDPAPAITPKPKSADWGRQRLEERRRQEAIVQGERASDALQAALSKPEAAPAKELRPLPSPALPSRIQKNIRQTIKVYPSLALGMLKADLAAPGRVYWLLKHLDRRGRGWLSVNQVRHRLTGQGSKLRVCSWRRLRQILNQGEGILWQRDEQGRLWLFGAAKTAQKLVVGRLVGHPVEIPVKALLGGIKRVRAHFYASFHSGRREENPISRETLREVTGVPERTQREYDQLAKVKIASNLAIGERYNRENVQSRAWRQGRGVFQFVDVQGEQGKAGREYVAWRLPNNYHGPHDQRAKGRQKKINRELTDLFMKGMTGNGEEPVGRLFWSHGAAAGRAYNRSQEKDAYWSGGQARVKPFILWHVLSGEEC